MFYRLHCFSRPLARCAKIISLLLLLSNTHIQPLEAKDGTKQQDYFGNQHIIITIFASLCCIWFLFCDVKHLSNIKIIVDFVVQIVRDNICLPNCTCCWRCISKGCLARVVVSRPIWGGTHDTRPYKQARWHQHPSICPIPLRGGPPQGSRLWQGHWLLALHHKQWYCIRDPKGRTVASKPYSLNPNFLVYFLMHDSIHTSQF